MMRMTAILGLQVFLGLSARLTHRLQVVCSTMQTTTILMQSSQTVPVYSLPTLHRPRSTCVSILTQPTAVPTVAVAPTLLTYRASTTTEPLLLLDQHGTLISPDSPTTGRARVPARTFATRSKLRIQRLCGRVNRTKIWPSNSIIYFPPQSHSRLHQPPLATP